MVDIGAVGGFETIPAHGRGLYRELRPTRDVQQFEGLDGKSVAKVTSTPAGSVAGTVPSRRR